jgi:hypothetical protein
LHYTYFSSPLCANSPAVAANAATPAFYSPPVTSSVLVGYTPLTY